eukprot:CAMPEP_0176440100 /NCGR_PEP_ID=MMETSP0127-20121128/20361_1 /TAXON_ID=938130 /ORGANISM="Platyophrya macrostoma, Strain WH" /LENGTH=59 /DNA_ID=CAMNT_0017824543 /DNA_START=701 /DNA_END=880 /DNA_ORIENTATION=-
MHEGQKIDTDEDTYQQGRRDAQWHGSRRHAIAPARRTQRTRKRPKRCGLQCCVDYQQAS